MNGYGISCKSKQGSGYIELLNGLAHGGYGTVAFRNIFNGHDYVCVFYSFSKRRLVVRHIYSVCF